MDDIAIMEPRALTDAELVHRAISARSGQERTAAFPAIADRYQAIVLRRCARWLRDCDAAQEVGQSTFAEAFGLLWSGKGPREPDKLAGWLITIAHDRRLAYVRTLAGIDPTGGRCPTSSRSMTSRITSKPGQAARPSGTCAAAPPDRARDANRAGAPHLPAPC